MKARASGAGPPIYPARALVLLAVAGAPVAAVVGALAPSLWLVGPAWVAALSGLLLLDALMAGGPRRAEITVETPAAVSIGSRVSALVRVAFPRGRAPVEVELALAVDPRLGPDPRARVRVEGRVAEAPFELRPDRRGPAPVA
ncbi:MAG TPA: hypothetical protein VGB49_07195, partial [Caulobacteraceae bacterium]